MNVSSLEPCLPLLPREASEAKAAPAAAKGLFDFDVESTLSRKIAPPEGALSSDFKRFQVFEAYFEIGFASVLPLFTYSFLALRTRFA